MRTLLLAALVAGLVSIAPSASFAGDPPTAPAAAPAAAPVKLMNAHCPVTGEEVNPELSHVWNGIEIRFCCEGCIPDFVKDPAKYMPRLLTELVAQREAVKASVKAPAPAAAPSAPAATATPPTAAPSAPAAPPAPVQPVAPAASGARALVDLENSHCPVMEAHLAKADSFLEYHGMKVRLCCRGCVAKFYADPATYLAKLRVEPAVAARIDAAEAAWAAAPKPPAPPAPPSAPLPPPREVPVR